MTTTLLAYPFRLFFLLVGLYGVAIVLAWTGFLFGGLALPVGWSPLHWHSHEMLFGFTSAAVAGFILTAVCNWTGAPPLQGGKLLLLGLVWSLGRVAMWSAGYLPLWLVALLDMLFLPALGVILLRILLAYGNKRNLLLGGMILALSAANLLMHIGFITGKQGWLVQGETLAMNLITLIMLVIGGRIIPMFSANWWRNQGINVQPRVIPALDKACLLITALLIPAAFAGLPWLTGGIALAAAVLNAWRWLGWRGWRTWSEPLLWVLHIGYGWLVIALLLKGLAAFALVGASAWQHALGAGAMGTLILGVMTRVALGHTGRPLQLPPLAWLIYVGICVAAVCRMAAALGWTDYRLGVMFAAAGWCFAFSLFTVIYWPILSRPRLDGRPG
ncbi:NnrS family protein [Cellvibrio japonicus]|uniref:NnrS protein superfamily n=1 Tax=Cellvibrio japonicus (strain Ueda107) TaxID=498211 RepID=B3PE40_CELJU|nr:NnrS family protein [Cellvibrio japonicus]ACE86081.1 NnrS protein superfamily [Cellvibrio japonicus Ueda107]QEI12087.1 NnrS family protein [Cellvibrio japonicus]QEI15661.1 NnrS family protein [Cellvibrio japonicus]QEI19239.1 NnrS family protein [Cellvibrio japonicus]